MSNLRKLFAPLMHLFQDKNVLEQAFSYHRKVTSKVNVTSGISIKGFTPTSCACVCSYIAFQKTSDPLPMEQFQRVSGESMATFRKLYNDIRALINDSSSSTSTTPQNSPNKRSSPSRTRTPTSRYSPDKFHSATPRSNSKPSTPASQRRKELTAALMSPSKQTPTKSAKRQRTEDTLNNDEQDFATLEVDISNSPRVFSASKTTNGNGTSSHTNNRSPSPSPPPSPSVLLQRQVEQTLPIRPLFSASSTRKNSTSNNNIIENNLDNKFIQDDSQAAMSYIYQDRLKNFKKWKANVITQI